MVNQRAETWYERFNRHAGDLYPGRYTRERCRELSEQAEEIFARAAAEGSLIAAHNYQYPEFHEIAGLVGDSLELSLRVRELAPPRVDFQSVFFMGATAKIIVGDATRVFVTGTPETLGCSLVFGTDHAWIERWKRLNPGGVVVTYVNSDLRTKARSDYASTSRNTHTVIAKAAREHPDARILVLPDKYLGMVMRMKAAELGVDPERVDVYAHRFGGFDACCYVHERIGMDAAERALDEYPDAELMIHPECGCASACLLKMNAGEIPNARAYFLSTSQMIERARRSDARRFLVATEKGMIYRLRTEVPEKEFLPVSAEAECRYMKANTLGALLRTLREGRYEIVIREEPNHDNEFVDGDRIVLPAHLARAARRSVERMLEAK